MKYCLLLMIVICSNIFTEEALINTTKVSGVYVTAKGDVLTSSQAIVGSEEIFSMHNGEKVEYKVNIKDPANGFFLLTPENPMDVNPVPLLLPELEKGDKVICIDQENDICEGIVIENVGIKNDIRHFQVELLSEGVNKGIVIDSAGRLAGLISRRETDIYTLIQPSGPVDGKSRVVAIKTDSFYNFLRNVEGVNWVTGDDDSLKNSEWQVKPVELTISMKNQQLLSDQERTFQDVRMEIPPNVLFINVKISSGIQQSGFASILLSELKKEKIGREIPLSLKKEYYKKTFERYGNPGMNPEELVKIAADLSAGYYMEASCSIVSGSVEDSVELKVFSPHSIEPLCIIKADKVVANTNTREDLKELTVIAVKKLSDTLNKKQSPLLNK